MGRSPERPGRRLIIGRLILALAPVLVNSVVATQSLSAQSYAVVYSFTGAADGGVPVAGLIKDAAGTLYGTTWAGGALGDGTLFKFDGSDNETVLYSFQGGVDGQFPTAGLVRDAAGNLYGTTTIGALTT